MLKLLYIIIKESICEYDRMMCPLFAILQQKGGFTM